MASSDFSLAYEAAGTRAGDYRDGDGERINASRFETTNQQITAAYRSGQDLYQAQAALQYMPYEGFPNADMDLAGNIGAFINARYQGSRDWGELSISAYYDHIRHQMNGDAADRYAPSPVGITSMGLMPTRERSALPWRPRDQVAWPQRSPYVAIGVAAANGLAPPSFHSDRCPSGPFSVATIAPIRMRSHGSNRRTRFRRFRRRARCSPP